MLTDKLKEIQENHQAAKMFLDGNRFGEIEAATEHVTRLHADMSVLLAAIEANNPPPEIDRIAILRNVQRLAAEYPSQADIENDFNYEKRLRSHLTVLVALIKTMQPGKDSPEYSTFDFTKLEIADEVEGLLQLLDANKYTAEYLVEHEMFSSACFALKTCFDNIALTTGALAAVYE